ncbi:hypothetical protein [Deinococcus radiotolerans]|uniref:Transposase DDE domain-containing protein n=1 Tax=Deinococcus radiotolerans TaxID=1309407 RepID=A0ABQ2FQ30_9DEIO|nr:hypothetical protein [Deinococcus radiotolerans]GGL15607.1 hypothetical protein GCM10010844_38160 [Deinococcus radiotolerans]
MRRRTRVNRTRADGTQAPARVYHGSYLFDLTVASPAVRDAEFLRMLGTYTTRALVTGVQGTWLHSYWQAAIQYINNRTARAVAGTPHDTWPALQMVQWRGCWCVRVVARQNKRRVSGPHRNDLRPLLFRGWL